MSGWFRRETGRGRGGLAILVVGGPEGEAAVRALLEPGARLPKRVGRLALRALIGPSGVLDEALLARVADPADSDDDRVTLELGLHGGPAVVRSIAERLTELGLRERTDGPPSLATIPNTRLARAAEAALNSAMTELAARLALRCLDELESTIRSATLAARRDGSGLETLRALLAGAPRVRRLLSPSRVALIGAANAGKSTLFNALLGESRAIVSDTAGTTRDVIEEVVELAGLPLALLDTAGLRGDAGALEQEGMALGRRHAEGAELRLLLQAIDEPIPETPVGPAPIIGVLTKLDRAPAEALVAARRALQARLPAGSPVVAIAAPEGRGLDELALAIRAALLPGSTTLDEDAMSAPAPLEEAQARDLEGLIHDLEAGLDGRPWLARLLVGEDPDGDPQVSD